MVLPLTFFLVQKILPIHSTMDPWKAFTQGSLQIRYVFLWTFSKDIKYKGQYLSISCIFKKVRSNDCLI